MLLLQCAGYQKFKDLNAALGFDRVYFSNTPDAGFTLIGQELSQDFVAYFRQPNAPPTFNTDFPTAQEVDNIQFK